MDGIRRYQTLARDYPREPFTCLFVEEIIRNTNKTVQRGYVIIREFPVRAVGLVRQRTAADVAIVEIAMQAPGGIREVVLVVECKFDDNEARRALRQLTGYMDDTNCVHSIAMSPNIAILYHNGANIFPDQVGRELNMNSDEDIVTMMEFINNL